MQISQISTLRYLVNWEWNASHLFAIPLLNAVKKGLIRASTMASLQPTQEAQAVEHQAATTIEVASDNTTDDPGYETESVTGAETSISSSVRDYAFEHGRRYHKYQEGRYLFPNDESEQEREDMKHSMIVNLCGGRLHYAPLEDPREILDIGTGTGIWAIDSMSVSALSSMSYSESSEHSLILMLQLGTSILLHGF